MPRFYYHQDSCTIDKVSRIKNGLTVTINIIKLPVLKMRKEFITLKQHIIYYEIVKIVKTFYHPIDARYYI